MTTNLCKGDWSVMLGSLLPPTPSTKSLWGHSLPYQFMKEDRSLKMVNLSRPQGNTDENSYMPCPDLALLSPATGVSILFPGPFPRLHVWVTQDMESLKFSIQMPLLW